MVLAVATALDHHTGDTSRRMSVASSSSDSSSSTELATAQLGVETGDSGSINNANYESLKDVLPAGERTTRQAKDWRPKSTLHLKIRNGEPLTFWERISVFAIMPDAYHKLQPMDIDRGPIPTQSLLSDHLWILTWASPPFLLQQLSYWYYPEYKWPIALAYPLYVFFFANFLIQVVRRAGRYGIKYGMLDEKNITRDRVPDAHIPNLARAFTAYVFLRPAGEFFLSWDTNMAPIDAFRWTTLPRWIAYILIFDYFFYLYHRSCHEVDWLWHIHQRHHTTKHPSPALATLADEWQELIEICLVPLFSALLVPMHYHELSLLLHYLAFVEIWGHSGVRTITTQPIIGIFLEQIQCELLIEDHDLHHRYGKSGRNYGKQTRFWDILFGTTTPREEYAGLPGRREF